MAVKHSFEEWLASEIQYLGLNHRPEIVFRSRDLIIFREAEDLIAWFLKHSKKIWAVSSDAFRYICREDGGNRYYYLIKIKMDGSEIELLTGDATDYSGHGSYDKKLLEGFFRLVLKLDIRDFPSSYLIDYLIGALNKRWRGASHGR